MYLYAHAMMYEHVMLLHSIFAWENKSLTAAEEYQEAESRTAVGYEEYTYFQILLKGCFRRGLSLAC